MTSSYPNVEVLASAYKTVRGKVGNTRPFNFTEFPGSIDCPGCHGVGSLKFQAARSNGHTRAMCTTPGCISWVE